MPEQTSKIPWMTAGFMLGSAFFFFDLLKLLLDFLLVGFILNYLVDFFAYLTFWMWFHKRGVSFRQPSRFLLLNGLAVIELIPFVNRIADLGFVWTVDVFLLILTVWAEERLAQVAKVEKFT